MKKLSKNIKSTLPAFYGFTALSLFILYLFCTAVTKAEVLKVGTRNKSDDKYFKIWALSDIQPREKAECDYFETAVSDINKNVPDVDIAIVGGDIIHWSKSKKYYECYINTRQKSYIKYWYEIAGNHDHKDYDNYQKYIDKPLFYSVTAGNIIILLLSDINKVADTEIPDRAFLWWKEKVIENQDRIIITVTHGLLKQSGLFGTIEPTRNIRHSEQFTEVLRKYRVDIWLCGHAHIPHWIDSRINIKKRLGGTLFINVSAIRGNFFKNPESDILIFKKGSDIVQVKSRDHEDAEFDGWLGIDFRLSRKFEWDGKEPVMKAME
ncbi:MAG: metallophosphoesterase [Spirochaetes bacterium]|nr:metallophosphoesterase [Spirochaetota bacterium]